LAEATALLTELENQEPMSGANDLDASTSAAVDTAENALSTTVHFTTDVADENDVFDQNM